MAIVANNVREILDSRDPKKLVELIFDQSVEDEQRPSAVTQALRELAELDYKDLAKLAVQASVELPEKVCRQVRHYFLGKWIKSDGFDQRPTVLRLLAERLDRADVDQRVQIIRAVQFIGYRDDGLVDKLEKFAGIQGQGGENDDVEAWALTALARVGYPHPQRITDRLQSRLDANGEFNEADCWTAFYHASPQMLHALFDAISWDKPALIAIANLVERQPGLAPEAWLRFNEGDTATHWLNQGRMAEAIGLPEVGSALAKQAIEALRDHETRNTMVSMNRLIGAYSERVIKGAKDSIAGLHSEELAWIKKPATLLDPLNIRVMTSEGYDKDAAWKIILHLGLPESRSWLKEALGDTPSRSDLTYADYAGYLQQGDVVPALAKAISGEDVDFGYGLHVMEALGVLGTEEALHALLGNKVWFDGDDAGGIPEKYVDALVSASITLGSDDPIWNALLDDQREFKVRLACAYALQRLAYIPNAPKPRIKEIRDLLRAEKDGQPGWEQLLILLSKADSSVETHGLLNWAALQFSGNRSVTEALARAGILNSYEDRLTELGLCQVDGKWRAEDDLGSYENLILLILYKKDLTFEQAMIDVLEVASYSTAANILYNLDRGESVSSELAEALFDRLIEGKGGFFSGSGTVHAIGNVAPNLLLRPTLLKAVEGWQSGSIADYLGQLKDSQIDIEDKEALVRLGAQYLENEDVSVRREAARLLRKVSVKRLEEEVSRMMTSAERLDQWIFAIQAGSYLDMIPDQWREIRDTHREPEVRALMRTTIDEVKRSALARSYTSRVLAEPDVLSAWAYGNALLQIGDEESVEALLDDLPPEVHRRAYLINLSKQIEKASEERRKKLDSSVVLPPLIGRETLASF